MAELQSGDILVQGKFHALMWVGGDKPIVHNANKGQFHGVLQQSLSGAIGPPKGKSLDLFFESAQPGTYAVYRCDDPTIAAHAADFAVGWATPSGSQEADDALKNKGGFLKTKYSDDRMLDAEDATPEQRQWSVAAMFRALKAYARFEEALTPKHGSSCSQFIVYCYQAGTLRKYFGDLDIEPQKLKQIKLAGGYSKLSARASGGDTEAKQLIEVVEQAEVVFRSKAVPAALMSHAKVTYVGSLIEQLTANGSGFTKVGCLVPNRDLTAARIAAGNPAPDWQQAQTRVGFV